MEKNKISTKISQLEHYMSKFDQMLPKTQEIYLNSMKEQLAIERLLQISIECVIDIAMLLIKHLQLGPPNSEDHALNLLDEKIETISIIKNMKGFRNIIVHKYGQIDNKLVYYFACHNLNDFREIIDEVEHVLKET